MWSFTLTRDACCVTHVAQRIFHQWYITFPACTTTLIGFLVNTTILIGFCCLVPPVCNILTLRMRNPHHRQHPLSLPAGCVPRPGSHRRTSGSACPPSPTRPPSPRRLRKGAYYFRVTVYSVPNAEVCVGEGLMVGGGGWW